MASCNPLIFIVTVCVLASLCALSVRVSLLSLLSLSHCLLPSDLAAAHFSTPSSLLFQHQTEVDVGLLLFLLLLRLMFLLLLLLLLLFLLPLTCLLFFVCVFFILQHNASDSTTGHRGRSPY